jgi:repressor LexA
VKYHIDALANSGVLRRRARQARALETIRPPFSLPLLGRIAAGQPLLAVENVEENVTLDRFRDCFLLRVKGDSMIGAAIMDSDLVVVRPQESAHNGEIVVALIDNEATVKRFRREGKDVLLESENPKYSPIRVVAGEREFALLGRVVGVLRAY